MTTFKGPPVTLWQYKLLVILLYNSDIPGVARNGVKYRINVPVLARYLGIRIYRLKSTIEALELTGTIFDVMDSRNRTKFELLPPPHFVLDKSEQI